MRKISLVLLFAMILFSCSEPDSVVPDDTNTDMENGDDPNMDGSGEQGGGDGGSGGDGGATDPDVCDQEFDYSRSSANNCFFLASHVTNYVTQFENFSIQPVEVNNMMAGNAAYPGKEVGQRGGNTGFFRNPLPGSYDISSRDDRDCTVLKRFIVPGFYIVDHNLKLDHSVTRLDFVKNDAFMNSGVSLISMGRSWNDRLSPDNNPVIPNDVPLKPSLSLIDSSNGYDIFQPGFNSYSESAGNDNRLSMILNLPNEDGDIESKFSRFSGGGTVNIDITRSENFVPSNDNLDQHFNIIIDISDLRFTDDHILNGAILMTWIGNETPAQQINPIGG